MKLELKGNHTAIYGLKGSGKSNWLQYVLTRDRYSAHLAYDLCREHAALNRYTPTHRRGEKAAKELETVTNRMVLDVERERRPELYAVEEISRFCGSSSPPPEPLYDLIDLNRHYGVGLLTIGRRPAQVHTDVTELADNVVIFPLSGDNDIRKLNRMVSGLGDTVAELPEYHYVLVQGREYEVHAPVPEMDTTGAL